MVASSFSAKSLDKSLDGKLHLQKGDSASDIISLIWSRNWGSLKRVVWNRCYEPWRIQRDKNLKELLEIDAEVEVQSFNGSLLVGTLASA